MLKLSLKLVVFIITIGCNLSFSETNFHKRGRAIIQKSPPYNYKPNVTSQLYNTFFANKDVDIFRMYIKTWPSYNDAFITTNLYNTASNSPTSEIEKRKLFAEKVLKMRIDSAIKQYFSSRDTPHELRKIHETIDKAKNQAIYISKNPHSPMLQLGYDIINDIFKIEYINGSFICGIYHSKFIGETTNKNIIFLRLSYQLLKYIMGRVNMPLSNDYIEINVSNKFSPLVEGRLRTIQPLKNKQIHQQYLLGLSYNF